LADAQKKSRAHILDMAMVLGTDLFVHLLRLAPDFRQAQQVPHKFLVEEDPKKARQKSLHRFSYPQINL